MAFVAGALSCRSNPFGSTNKSIEEFTVYTSDFTAQTDGGAKAALLEVINGAKSTLNCAFSALTLTDISSALIGKASSGVQVKVAFDADVKTSDAGSAALQASGAFTVVTTPIDTKQSQLLYGNGGTAYMRHNFCLADERYIYISTSAPDDTQMRKIPAIALKIGSPQFGIARDFLRESNMFSQLLFGNGKAKTDFTTKFTALNQVIGAYWGPQEKPLDILGTNLSEATVRVDFYSTAFQTTNSSKTDLDIPQVLLRLESAKGIPLKKYFSSQALFDSASRAYTLSNPYQYVNSGVTVGSNIFLVDRGLSTAKTFIYTGALRSQANSSDDGVLLELRGKYVADIVGAYLDKIGAASNVVSNSGDTGSSLDVAISELHWMGSYSNAFTSDSTDEFVEFYNNKSVAVNISGWKFACTADGSTANTSITLPAGALVAPGGFFVVANKSTGAFPNSNFFDSKVSTTNGSIQCRLGDGQTAATVYGITNFGNIVDTAGLATAFDTVANMGTNDSTNKVRRSMERVNTTTSGANTSNWQANVFSASQNTGVASGFRDQTFASPGAALSTALVPPGTFKITEISIDGSADSIELRCTAGGSIGGFKLNLSNSLRYTFPAATFVAGDIIVFHAQAAGTDETGGNASASGDAGATTGYDFWQAGSSITSTDAELEITDSGSVSQDYVAWTDGVFGSGQSVRVDAHITSSHWTKAAGTIAETDLVDSTIDDSSLCLQRVNTGAGTAHTDTNSRSDWIGGTCNLGTNQSTTAPAFNVASAIANVDSTHMTVTFSSAPNFTQSQVAGNYCVSFSAEADCSGPDLTISGASLSGNTVTLTTSGQGAGTGYRVYVTGVVAAAGGASLTTNTAAFTGFLTPATLIINEVAPNEASSRDLIELYAVTAGTVNGLEIFEGGTSVKILPNTVVAAGDYLVIHINATGTDETVSKTQSADSGNIAGAWDFWSSDTGLTGTDNAIILKNSGGTILDACIFGNTSGTWTGPTISTVIDPAITAGQWTKAGGTFIESDAVNHATSIPAGSSFRRSPNAGDTNNSRLDWTSAAGLTIGSANP